MKTDRNSIATKHELRAHAENRLLHGGWGGGPIYPISTPEIAGYISVDIAGNTYPKGVYVSGGYAYVTLEYDRYLQVIDIADPTNPTLIGNVSINVNNSGLEQVIVCGNVAFINLYNATAGNGGLTAVDISNPTSPSIISTYTGDTDIKGCLYMDIVGNYAYLSNRDSDKLVIIDISDPANMTKTGSYAYADPGGTIYPYGVKVIGKYAYWSLYQLMGTVSNVVILNVSDPTTPTLAGELGFILEGGRLIEVVGKYLYTVGTIGYLSIIDISDPATPVYVTRISIDAWAYSMKLEGSVLYIGTSDSGIILVDVSDPTTPSILTSLEDATYLNNVNGFGIDGNYLYATEYDNFYFTVVDLKGINARSSVISAGHGSFTDMNIHDDVDIGRRLNVRGSINVGGNIIISGGGITANHSSLSQLDYASAGHTGFEATLGANQKIDHSAVSILNGNGITGGGDLTSSRTLALTTLTSDWDIGDGRMIQADKIRARDGDGLALYEDGDAGIFIKDGGNVGIGTISPATKLTVHGGSSSTFLGTEVGLASIKYSDAALSKYACLDFKYYNSDNPVARIAAYVTPTGCHLKLGTSKTYANGIENTAINIDPDGKVTFGSDLGIGFTIAPSSILHIADTPLATFQNNTPGIFLISQAVAALSKYSCLDFRYGVDNGLACRIAARLESTGAYLYFGTATSYSTGIATTNCIMKYDGTTTFGANPGSAKVSIDGGLHVGNVSDPGDNNLMVDGQIESGNLYPLTDNTYYVGKNDDDTPRAWKGVILKDQTDGKYYRIELNNGAVSIVDLTD